MAEQSTYRITADAARQREQHSVRYFMEPWARGLIAAAALQPGERVLDVACGTGVVTRLAAPAVGPAGQVTGLDINAPMLAVARSMPPPPGASIKWVEGNAVAMDFPDASFEVTLCQQGLQFFSDRLAAAREMRRVLAPKGRVVLGIWKSAGPYNIAVGDALERHAGSETATRFRASRIVPDAEALHRLFADAGFASVQVRPSTLTLRLPALDTFVLDYLSGNRVAAAVAALSETQRVALARQVKTALQPYADGEGVAVPDEINLIMARR